MMKKERMDYTEMFLRRMMTILMNLPMIIRLNHILIPIVLLHLLQQLLHLQHQRLHRHLEWQHLNLHQSVLLVFHDEILMVHLQNIDLLLKKCIHQISRRISIVLIHRIPQHVEHLIRPQGEHQIRHRHQVHLHYVPPILKLLLLFTESSLVILISMVHIIYPILIPTTFSRSSLELRISVRLPQWETDFPSLITLLSLRVRGIPKMMNVLYHIHLLHKSKKKSQLN